MLFATIFFLKKCMCCLKTYSRLFRVIHVLQIDNFSQSATDVVCVCYSVQVHRKWERSATQHTYTAILELAHSAFCVCTAIVMKCFSTPPQNHLVTLYGIAQLLSQQTSNTVCACTILRPVWPGWVLWSIYVLFYCYILREIDTCT